jgi:hypothetical protein
MGSLRIPALGCFALVVIAAALWPAVLSLALWAMRGA